MNVYPYVYRLDHPITGEFYIGYRSANTVSAKDDLGHKYFTSSRHVKPRFNEFNYQVIAEFFDAESAYDFEQDLIYSFLGTKNLLNKKCHYASKDRWCTAGKPLSAEFKEKLKLAAIRRYSNPEEREKASARSTGKKASAETKMKMRASKKNISDETRAKIGMAHKGKFMSQETRDKIGAAQRGKVVSQETRDKVSAAHKERVYKQKLEEQAQ